MVHERMEKLDELYHFVSEIVVWSSHPEDNNTIREAIMALERFKDFEIFIKETHAISLYWIPMIDTLHRIEARKNLNENCRQLQMMSTAFLADIKKAGREIPERY